MRGDLAFPFRWLGSGNGNEEAFCTAETCGGLESGEGGSEGLVSDPQSLAEDGSSEGLLAECGEDSLVEFGVDSWRGMRCGRLADEAEVRCRFVNELEQEGLGTSVGPVLGAEFHPFLSAQEIEARIGPGMEIARAAKGLPGLVGRGLADVVDECDRDGVHPL